MNPSAVRSTAEEQPSEPRVRDLMTAAVVTVGETETIDLANAEMKWSHVRHLPVVDAAGRFIGLVSKAELLAVIGRQRTAEKVPVGLAMRQAVFTINPDASLVEAMELMLDSKLTALPVVDDAGKLVGILTESDFVRHVYKELTGRSFLTAV